MSVRLKPPLNSSSLRPHPAPNQLASALSAHRPYGAAHVPVLSNGAAFSPWERMLGIPLHAPADFDLGARLMAAIKAEDTLVNLETTRYAIPPSNDHPNGDDDAPASPRARPEDSALPPPNFDPSTEVDLFLARVNHAAPPLYDVTMPIGGDTSLVPPPPIPRSERTLKRKRPPDVATVFPSEDGPSKEAFHQKNRSKARRRRKRAAASASQSYLDPDWDGDDIPVQLKPLKEVSKKRRAQAVPMRANAPLDSSLPPRASGSTFDTHDFSLDIEDVPVARSAFIGLRMPLDEDDCKQWTVEQLVEENKFDLIVWDGRPGSS
ncbi:hypothetical protein LXA43DRAFT_1099741 [Ganoderma leucocontextum]|nr:hypothetical protein LXA43DRAFT_1099741 [Ganoderma leucocontextum]